MCVVYFRDLLKGKREGRRKKERREGGKNEGRKDHLVKTWRCHVRVKTGRHLLKWYQRERSPYGQQNHHHIFLLHKCIKGGRSKCQDVCGFPEAWSLHKNCKREGGEWRGRREKLKEGERERE